VRVALADAVALFRAGLTSLLTESGITVTAAVGSSEQLLAAVDRDSPDAAIIDIRMPPTHTTGQRRVARSRALSECRSGCRGRRSRRLGCRGRR